MESSIAEVLQGKLQGCVGKNLNGSTFHKFLGIPFAKPPVGKLRFKDPIPADPWTGIRDATKEGSPCYSRCEITFSLIGSEDCLYLNVFTKELPGTSKNLKPVMVWIYGGAFLMGSNRTAIYGPEFLMNEDIVLVTINYRTGILGFLKLDDPSLGVSGNAGLKDQVLALKWVKNNIENFNGDPNNITIFGESAGAVSVHYQVLSPMSKDLFQKAIIQSGAALCGWAVCDHDAVKIAKSVDQQISNEKEALESFRNLPVEKLHQVQESYKDPTKPSSPFGPVIENPSTKKGFLMKHPIDIITSGEYNKVSLIFGYTSREGMLIEYINQMQPGAKAEAAKCDNSIPWVMNLEKGSDKRKDIVKKMENLYFNGKEDKDDAVYLMQTDHGFLMGILSSIKNHLQTSPYPIYLYKMTIESSLNIFKKKIGLEKPGVCHGDDIGYLFKHLLTPEIKPDSLEEVSFKRFVKLWTNFAKFGNPTPEPNDLGVVWKPVRKNQLNYLNIGEELTMEVNPEAERVNLWREIFHQSSATANYL